jgi:hypothetical protein
MVKILLKRCRRLRACLDMRLRSLKVRLKKTSIRLIKNIENVLKIVKHNFKHVLRI